jgi:hypothetical protein
MPLLTDPFDDTPPDPHALNTRWTEHKKSVRACASADVDLATGLDDTTTIDGVDLDVGDRVLLVGQTDPAENGIYEILSGDNQRAADADAAEELTPGFIVDVDEGSTHRGKRYRFTTTGEITLGTTALNFSDTGTAPVTKSIPASRSGTFDNTPPDPIT